MVLLMGTSGIGNSCCCPRGSIRVAIHCGLQSSPRLLSVYTIIQYYQFTSVPIPYIKATGPNGFNVTTSEIDQAGNYVVHITNEGEYTVSMTGDPYWFDTSATVIVKNEFSSTLVKMFTCRRNVRLVEIPIGCYMPFEDRFFIVPETKVEFTGKDGGGGCSYTVSETSNEGCEVNYDQNKCGAVFSVNVDPPESSGFVSPDQRDLGLIACGSPDSVVSDRSYLPLVSNGICIGNIYPVITPLHYRDDYGECELDATTITQDGQDFNGVYSANFPSYIFGEDCTGDGFSDFKPSDGDLECLVWIKVTLSPIDDHTCEARIVRTISGACLLYDSDCKENFCQWRQTATFMGLGPQFIDSHGSGISNRRDSTSISATMPYDGPDTVYNEICGEVDVSSVKGIKGTATINGD